MIDITKKALNFATIKHEGQKRKGANPVDYINHPIAVAQLVNKYLKKENKTLIAVAYLHDTLEDTNTTYEELLTIFGKRIANLVVELTSNKIECKKLGKAKYLSLKLNNMSNSALIVKLCDRLSNVTDLISTNYLFRKKYFNETITILNYILKNRNLNKIHKEIINDIMHKLNNIFDATPLIDYNEYEQLNKIKELISIKAS